MGGKFYAVRVGRRPGIYNSWDEVKPLVEGFPGAQHKSFKARNQAEDYLAAGPSQAAGTKRGRDDGASARDQDEDDDHRYQPQRRTGPPSAAPTQNRGDSRPPRARDPSPGCAPPPAPVYVTSGILIVEGPRVTSASGLNHAGGSGGMARGAAAAGGHGGSAPRSRFDAVVEGPLQPINSNTAYDLEFDGAARGNPGQAGCGALLRRSDTKTVVCRLRKYMGARSTNNEAEYTALIEGLRMARRVGATRINALGDSKLVVMQVKGLWNINKDHLRALHGQVREETQQLVEFSIRHIPREHNADADKLSNDAIDLAYR